MTEELKDNELERRLHKLREQNTARWRRIEELHAQRTVEANTSKATPLHPSHRMLSNLKTETDLLSDNGVYQECDRLLEQREQMSLSGGTAAHEQRDMYAAEVVDSFHQLVQTNQILSESIQWEKQKLEAMETSVAELTEIKRVVSGMQSKKATSEDPKRQAAGSASIDVVSMEKDATAFQDEEEKRQNQQLKDDLSYLASCLDKLLQHENKTDTLAIQENRTDDTTSKMGLDELVLELLDQLFSSPDAPYLSVDEDSRTRPDHVDLLKKCWMVQTFRDDENLIRLLDYHC